MQCCTSNNPRGIGLVSPGSDVVLVNNDNNDLHLYRCTKTRDEVPHDSLRDSSVWKWGHDNQQDRAARRPKDSERVIERTNRRDKRWSSTDSCRGVTKGRRQDWPGQDQTRQDERQGGGRD